MTGNEISLKSINELLPFHFFIPSYQRGYRWTKRQVQDLLDDIWEFAQRPSQHENDIYCLQPVVVTDRAGKWELIDGQQRLTTIYILLSYINNSVFKDAGETFVIEFETRPDSQGFLEHINESQKDKNIDHFHIYSAFQTIHEWFQAKGSAALVATKFYPVLLDKTKVIWYQVGKEVDPIDIFTRINMGKIPLTNSELVKALFLRSDNFTEANKDSLRLKQIEIANEWDTMELALQDSEFWYFLNEEENKMPTRIEFIFDLMANKSTRDDDYFTFRFFNEKFKAARDISDVWLEVKKYFKTFEEWFKNRELYHLIGYLITVGLSLKEIKEQSEGKTKTAFKKYLQDKVKEQVDCQIDSLEYNNPFVRKVLLLHNIETVLSGKNSNARFPFDQYKLEDWDIEHIHAVRSRMPNNKPEQKEWIDNVLKYIDSKAEFAAIKDKVLLYKEATSVEEGAFEKIYETFLNACSEGSVHTDVNSLSNLTLLDAGTNRSYKNAVFPIKRKIILEKEREGAFIPLCTKHVFLKYYSEDISQMSLWGSEDRQHYLESLKRSLNNYLPQQEENLN